jgi:hypothetical protein
MSETKNSSQIHKIKEYTQREFLSLFNEYNQWVKSGYNNLGRNDTCPCGSGKKYKKCCLGVFDNSEFLKFEKLKYDVRFISLNGHVKNITEEMVSDYFSLSSVKEIVRNDFGQRVEVLKILF